MATVGAKESTAEAIRIAEDAANRYMDQGTAIGRTIIDSWSSSMQAAVQTGFDLQNNMMQVSRSIMEASAAANRSWFDQSAEAMRKNQEMAARMMAVGMDMINSATVRPRG